MFISVIPDQHKFTVKDAIIGHPKVHQLKNNDVEDNHQSDQFLSPKIFNFFQNVKLPPIPLLNNNLFIKRPNLPPPSSHSKPPSSTFSQTPENHSPNHDNNNNKIPNHESNSNHQASEALNIFNAGLDNFIKNPASLTQVPRPITRSRKF